MLKDEPGCFLFLYLIKSCLLFTHTHTHVLMQHTGSFLSGYFGRFVLNLARLCWVQHVAWGDSLTVIIEQWKSIMWMPVEMMPWPSSVRLCRGFSPNSPGLILHYRAWGGQITQGSQLHLSDTYEARRPYINRQVSTTQNRYVFSRWLDFTWSKTCVTFAIWKSFRTWARHTKCGTSVVAVCWS